jgi:spermidine synthase
LGRELKTFTENEPTSPINARYQVERVLFRGKSKHQKILVFDSPFHGRVLALDDIVQLTTREERYYHEMLVHPIMQAHPDPRNVLIIGGGDGGALREAVKYPSVEKAVECELDRQVVAVAQAYFPKLASGYKDKRAYVRFEDGQKFLQESGQVWDAIILDLTDPIGPAKPLFERPFYKLCSQHLAPDGLLSAQTESLHFHADTVKSVLRALRGLFEYVELVTVPLTMYPGNWWTFTVASKSLDPKHVRNPYSPATDIYTRENHDWFFLPDAIKRKVLRAA